MLSKKPNYWTKLQKYAAYRTSSWPKSQSWSPLRQSHLVAGAKQVKPFEEPHIKRLAARRVRYQELRGPLGDGQHSAHTCLVTISGHGSQLPDLTNYEHDKLEEAWVLFEKQILAQEIYQRFARFQAGVTIIVVQDLSYSAVFRRPPNMPEIKANLIVLAGSSENQTAADGVSQGIFTESLLQTWAKGTFSGNYNEFISAIGKKMPSAQTPQLYVYAKDKSVELRKPFVLTF
ncbi:caspase family protein [Desulfovibrio inopinatus]|uniref:caspase family protein n=1 Tax=Desulfovibrio inopinatus TaxID=102109 RepID=UPI00042119A0|nr:caspase family protein [Desulfovibrio inopinatus]